MAKYHSEFHHLVDDAWYSVRTELSGEKLTVKYKDFTEEEDIVFEASSFTSLADLHAFRARFRSLSAQLQDNECDRVFRGVSVCASHSFNVCFYDAAVDDCNGVLDPKVEAFISLVKGKLAASSTAPKLLSLPMKPKSTFAQRLAQGTKCAKRSSPHATCPVEEVERGSSGTEGEDSFFEGDSNHCAGMMKEDGDFGGGRQLFGLLIDNLDKHLPPSAIVEFIHAKTSLSVQAYVFPSLPYETYSRGAIVVNCEKKLEKLCKFLGSPDYVVVSRDGRPWVVAEKLSQFNTFIGPIHALILKNQNKLHHRSSVVKSNDDLKLICSGSEEYTTAKQLRVLFAEFVEHQRRLHMSLAVEERDLQPSDPCCK